MKEIKHTILNCVFVRTFVITFYYGSGTVITVITVPVPASWQVTVPVLVPVPHGKKLRFLQFRFRFNNTAYYSYNTVMFRMDEIDESLCLTVKRSCHSDLDPVPDSFVKQKHEKRKVYQHCICKPG